MAKEKATIEAERDAFKAAAGPAGAKAAASQQVKLIAELKVESPNWNPLPVWTLLPRWNRIRLLLCLRLLHKQLQPHKRPFGCDKPTPSSTRPATKFVKTCKQSAKLNLKMPIVLQLIPRKRVIWWKWMMSQWRRPWRQASRMPPCHCPCTSRFPFPCLNILCRRRLQAPPAQFYSWPRRSLLQLWRLAVKVWWSRALRFGLERRFDQTIPKFVRRNIRRCDATTMKDAPCPWKFASSPEGTRFGH